MNNSQHPLNRYQKVDFSTLSESAQAEILKVKKITGFDYFIARLTPSGIVEVDGCTSQDDVDHNIEMGWSQVLNVK